MQRGVLREVRLDVERRLVRLVLRRLGADRLTDLRDVERRLVRLVLRRVVVRGVRLDVERRLVRLVRLVLRRLGDARRLIAIFIGLAVSLIASEMRVSMLLRRSLLSSRAAVAVMLSLTYLVFIALLMPDFTARSRPVERISLLVVLRVVLRVERRGAERLVVLRLVDRLTDLREVERLVPRREDERLDVERRLVRLVLRRVERLVPRRE